MAHQARRASPPAAPALTEALLWAPAAAAARAAERASASLHAAARRGTRRARASGMRWRRRDGNASCRSSLRCRRWLFGNDAAAAAASTGRRSLAFLQHERRRRVFRVDRRRRILSRLRLDRDVADVDDARELADAIEEQPQVVV